MEVVPQASLGVSDAEEPHGTFVENALAKARHASRSTRLPALADDSGICARALDGEPGVHSARFAGEPRSDARNNEKLIKLLSDQDRRRARSRAKKSREPPRQGAAAAARETERGRLMTDHPAGLRPPPLLKGGGESNVAVVAAPPSGVRFAQLPPLALYVHIPWCVKKCPYCDFNSHQARGDVPERAYVEALVTDLELALPDVWGRRVTSIFFGGGTPSLFSAAAIDTLISAFRARLSLAADCEITLEANPGTFEAEKFRAYREAGVNRLSIGIQSFNPEHLKALGRIHDEREARRAIEIAQDSFDNINLDLMVALPEQTLAEARADVEAALQAGTTHLSFYHLTLEPNTLFYRHPPVLPDDDAAAAMHDVIGAALAARGYAHYETSGRAPTAK